MPWLNCIHLIGNLGADPQLRKTGNGTPVANFSLATQYKGEPVWHRIVAFGREAEYAGTLLKGDQVYVQGRLDYRSYTDAQTQQDRTSAEIFAGSIQGLGKRNRGLDTDSGPAKDYPV